MARWSPISLSPYVETSGTVLKAFEEGTTTVALMATDNTGATTFTSVALNSRGNPEFGGQVIIPHIDRPYKLSLFVNQAAADANGPSIWTIDNLLPVTVNLIATFEFTKGSDQLGLSGTDTGAAFLDVVETVYYDSVKKPETAARLQFFGAVILGKAGNAPDADGFFYDAVGKQFRLISPEFLVNQFGTGNAAFDAAFAAARQAQPPRFVYGTNESTYITTSTLNISDDRFDGRGCGIVKNFAGVGINITGVGGVETTIRNFSIVPQSGFKATDFNIADNEHGIAINDTKVLIENVESNDHKGGGFVFDSADPVETMVGCVVKNISGKRNNIGCIFDGSLSGAPNSFSDLDLYGQFRDNFGFGVHSTAVSPLSDSKIKFFASGNGAGASFSEDSENFLDRIEACVIEYRGREATKDIKLGGLSSINTVQSIAGKPGGEIDLGFDNLWRFANRIYNPKTTVDSITLAKYDFSIDGFDDTHFYDIFFETNDIVDGGRLRVQGSAIRGPGLQFVSPDTDQRLGVTNDGIVAEGDKVLGTWVPSYLTGGTQFDNVVYDAATAGIYFKIGRMVFIQGFIQTDSITFGSATGDLVIFGLPFAVDNNEAGNSNRAAITIGQSQAFSGEAPISAVANPGTNTFTLMRRATSDAGTIDSQANDVGLGANSNTMVFSGTYIANV